MPRRAVAAVRRDPRCGGRARGARDRAGRASTPSASSTRRSARASPRSCTRISADRSRQPLPRAGRLAVGSAHPPTRRCRDVPRRLPGALVPPTTGASSSPAPCTSTASTRCRTSRRRSPTTRCSRRFPALLATLAALGIFGSAEAVTEDVLRVIEDLGGRRSRRRCREPIAQLLDASHAGTRLRHRARRRPLWAASGYVGAFGRGMNRIYGVEEGRPFWECAPRCSASRPWSWCWPRSPRSCSS